MVMIKRRYQRQQVHEWNMFNVFVVTANRLPRETELFSREQRLSCDRLCLCL